MLREKSMFTQNKDLFSGFQPISQTNSLLCTCQENLINVTDGITDCSYDHAVTCSTNITTKINCDIHKGLGPSNPNRRKRRDLYRIHKQNEIKPRNVSVTFMRYNS